MTLCAGKTKGGKQMVSKSRDIFGWAEQLMSMDEGTWIRHANPMSVWSRVITPLPLLTLSIWSRIDPR